MYCSSCGAAVKESTSFCKLCGAKLPGAKEESQNLPIALLIQAIAAIFVLGMGTAVGMMAMMKKYDINEGAINGFMLLIILLTVALDSSLLWLLFSRTRGTQGAREVSQDRLREQIIKELSAVQTRGLSEPVGSVTEHTTHKLEPILLNQPKANE